MKQAETSMTWLQSTNSANFSNSATRLLNTIFCKMEAVAGIIYRWVISQFKCYPRADLIIVYIEQKYR
jgi:hypothetical protein